MTGIATFIVFFGGFFLGAAVSFVVLFDHFNGKRDE